MSLQQKAEIVFAAIATVTGLGFLGLWLLRSPDTRVSRWLDRMDPAGAL